MSSADVVRDSLASQVAQQLSKLIQDGLYLPGEEFMGEVEAAAHFGVSRPVVREAFSLLSAQAYIEVKKGRRARVLAPDSRTLDVFFARVLAGEEDNWRDLMEVRMSLEILSARQAADRWTDATMAGLEDVLDSMDAAVSDPEMHSRLDVDFHIRLAEAAENTYLRHLIQSIRKNLLSIITSLRRKLPPEHYDTVTRRHHELVAAIRMRDADAAEAAMKKHFIVVWEGLDRTDPSTPPLGPRRPSATTTGQSTSPDDGPDTKNAQGDIS